MNYYKKLYVFKIIALLFLFVPFTLSVLTGCSINKLAVNMVADMLAGDESTVFTGDDDPELIGDALPFALKLYESLLEADPDNPRLLLATGKAFCLYSFAYIQTPAELLPYEEYEQQEHMLSRAKKLYLRAKNYIFHAIDIQIPGFFPLFDQEEPEKAFDYIKAKHLEYLYWGGTAWMGAVTADPFDMTLTIMLPRAVMLIEKIIEIDDSFDHGGAHELLVSYYGSVSELMGGSEEKARHHFRKAVEYSEGKKAGPYLALATSVCISKQYIGEFKDLMEKILLIDTSEISEYRLLNVLAQKKAAWYQEHLEDFFIIEEEIE